MNNKVVLIAHQFPPYDGVGQNRWANLSKGIARRGFDLTVLTVDRGTIPEEFSSLDVRLISKTGFYKYLVSPFKNHVLTALYLKSVDYIRRLFWFDDEAQHLGHTLLREINRLVQAHQKIVLIATGYPFQVNRWAGEAKKQHGNSIFLIQDFRDPWFDNPFKKYFFTFQKNKVREWQNDAIRRADINVYVTEGLRFLMETSNTKGVVIQNGHSFERESKEKISKGYIIHAGTLGNGREHAAEPFFQLCDSNRSVLGGRRVFFYGRISVWLTVRFKRLFDDGTFVHFDGVSKKALNIAYQEAAYALQFTAREFPYALSTKIFEHAAKGLPTLSINWGGEIDLLIKSNEIGESCRPDLDDIKNAIRQIEQKNYDKSLLEFSLRSHFDHRADQYCELIDNAFQLFSVKSS